ncbi:MAG: DUF1152 domain-containing protein [Hyperionvirus sp.]|uniref:DUF1152 domain-containing protein n=1 Tax=Hyperionvirus sp. TaxID=2487770 RepID=A0A3G5AD54_9VIRU|nr:MAG: DUF1152 domain-containing protein [Hyperionvirus sp.]
MEYEDNILIGGCGGGYDIFTGLPLYFRLKGRYNVFLSSFSLGDKKGFVGFEKVTDSSFVVDASIVKLDTVNLNFPEYLLAKELGEKIYCFVDDGLGHLVKDYEVLIGLSKIKTVILCDGGCDSLMRGSEEHLGTIVDDIMNVYAVRSLYLKKMVSYCYLGCLGMDVDTFIDINYSDMVDNIDRLRSVGGLIECFDLDEKEVETKKYIEIFEKCNPKFSIINCCIVGAIRGHRGNYMNSHLRERLGGKIYDKSPSIKISDITHKFHIFNLESVVKQNLFFGKLSDYDDSDKICDFVTEFNRVVRSEKIEYNSNSLAV